jgi:hypothetical protein
MLSRETGHSRVPAPPHMMTGIIGGASPACTDAMLQDSVLADSSRRKRAKGQAVIDRRKAVT